LRYERAWEWSCSTREPSQQQADKCHLDQRLAGLHLPLIVDAEGRLRTSQANTARRVHGSATQRRGWTANPWVPRVAPDDLQLPAAVPLAPARQLLAGVRTVRPDFLQARDARLEPGEQSLSATLIVHFGSCNEGRDRQPRRIDEDASRVAVVPADRGRFPDHLYALGIYDRCRWGGCLPTLRRSALRSAVKRRSHPARRAPASRRKRQKS
jgi:hypothetical protein